MNFKPGDKVMDKRGRAMRLTARVKIAGRKGWEARAEQGGNTLFVLDSEIKAAKVPEGDQCLLA